MAKGDLITVKKGNKTLTVTEKAYKLVYADLGFVVADSTVEEQAATEEQAPEVEKLTVEQVKSMTLPQIKAITPEQIELMTKKVVEATGDKMIDFDLLNKESFNKREGIDTLKAVLLDVLS